MRISPPLASDRPLAQTAAGARRMRTAPELAPPLTGPDADALALRGWRALTAEARPPHPRRKRREAGGAPIETGILLHRAGFGGAERVAYGLAERMAASGLQPRLYLCGEIPDPAPDGLAAFASVERLDLTDAEAAVEALGGLDMLIASQVDAAPPLFGALRERGVATVAHAHLVDRTAFDRDSGFAEAVLAHIGEVDLLLTASRTLARRMAALGAPAQRIQVLRNAPGFALDPQRADASLTARLARLATGAPLRALFLGRLDRQKGPGALGGMLRVTTRPGAALCVDWRIVGETVLGGAAPPDLARRAEPPVAGPGELQALYDWADVVVLPSLYEGAPLVILEAMRAGAIPVATATGAAPELMTQGIEGVLLRPGRTLSDGLAALGALDADRAMAAGMARAAHRRMIGVDWAATTAGPLRALRRLAEGEP